MATPKITVGMAVCGRVEWAMATIQNLNLYHPDVRERGQIVVIDNAPDLIVRLKNDRPCGHGDPEGVQALEAHCRGIPNCKYVRYTERTGTAAPRDQIFREADGEIVLVIDAHVFVAPDGITKLIRYFEANPDSKDLLQGPWMYDGIRPGACETHMEPNWRDGMFGTWACHPCARVPDRMTWEIDAAPFDIPSQGLGLYACRRDAWLGFNPHFRDFGGEEGYIHEKFRQAGRRTLCCLWLTWWHCFKNTEPPQYRNTSDSKLWNYLLGSNELRLPAAHLMHADHAVHHFVEEIKAVDAQAARRLQSEVGALPLWLPQSGLIVPPAPPSDPIGRVIVDRVVSRLADRTDAMMQSPVSVAIKSPPILIAGTGEELPRMDLPMVYCLMPTFGRAALARQSIESFLRQDYPRKRLLILNTGEMSLGADDRNVITEYHEPDLRGENGLPTLAELHAWLLGEVDQWAGGDQCESSKVLIRHWDDDDLCLPWSISQGVAFMTGGAKECLAWKPAAHWYEQAGQFIGLAHNKCEASVMFRRSALTQQSYDVMGRGGDLAELYTQLSINRRLMVRDMGPWSSYIYRFGVSPDHASGRPSGPTVPEIQERLRQYRDSHCDFDGVGDPTSALSESFRRVHAASYPWSAELVGRIAGDDPPTKSAGISAEAQIPTILDYKFADRTGMVACEVGRKHTGKLAEQVRIHRVLSVDADPRTIVQAQQDCGPMMVKVMWRAEIVSACQGCDSLPEWIDLIILSDPNPVAVLTAFRQLQDRVSNCCAICIPDWRATGAALLLRCVIEPTFVAEQIGSWLVFTARHNPDWIQFRPKADPV